MKRTMENRFFVEFYVDDDLKHRIISAVLNLSDELAKLGSPYKFKPAPDAEEALLSAIFESDEVQNAIDSVLYNAQKAVVLQYIDHLNEAMQDKLQSANELQTKIDKAKALIDETD